MKQYVIDENLLRDVVELIETVDAHRNYIGSAILPDEIDTGELVMSLKYLEAKNQVEEIGDKGIYAAI